MVSTTPTANPANAIGAANRNAKSSVLRHHARTACPNA